MKTKKFVLLSAALCVALGVSVFSAGCQYKNVYALESCSVEVTEHNSLLNNLVYDRMYKGENYTLYLDSELDDGREADTCIDRLERFSALLSEKGLSKNMVCYLSENIIANEWTEDGQIYLSFPAGITEEEMLAWMTAAQYGNYEIPYGIYAGVSAYWLDNSNFRAMPESAFYGAGYLTELQFPIYEEGNLTDHERAFAWNYSYTIVDDWIKSGKAEAELCAMTVDGLNDYLMEKYKVSLPAYSFSPYSTEYEYKVEQDCFTYYINAQFKDFVLPEEVFSTSYDCLSDWLNDNVQSTASSDEWYDVYKMHDINVYLNDGSTAVGAGQSAMGARENYIYIYSVGAFSAEYIHHIFYQSGQYGHMGEVFADLQANGSKYSNLMWYYIVSNQATYYYNGEAEREKFERTNELYNKISPTALSSTSFNYFLYADCYSALYTSDEDFKLRFEPVSLAAYVVNKYGVEYLWEMNLGTQDIAGKTYETIRSEWLNYITDKLIA